MKIIQTIISLALVTVFFASCSSHRGDNLSDDSANEEVFDFIDSVVNVPKSKIILVSIKESYSAGYEYSVSVTDVDGNRYVLTSEFSFNNEDWYEQLLETAETEEPSRKLEKDDMKIIHYFANNFTYQSSSYKEYPDSIIRDYGTKSLYGIYTDASCNPQYILLCTYGERIQCIDNDKIISFINWMADKMYFYVDKFRY